MRELNYLLNEVKSGLYVVTCGDSLDSISKKFNTTKRLISLDNFLDGEVSEGDVLYIKIYNQVHTVKPNETLEVIEKLYCVSKEEILNVNKTSFIYPYMQLVIK